jgi:two-component system sensor histidine kinase and response regulator WspE
MDTGDPVLIVDVEDIVQVVDKVLSGNRLKKLSTDTSAGAVGIRRVLVVDDSPTVREVEAQLLVAAGYHVDTAVDGMDGWNAAKMGSYDLIITDVDMPRMTGIELVSRLKDDAALAHIPVIIVSYKDRDDERLAGLDAGAAAFLTKGSFQDATLLDAVHELIGGGSHGRQ